MADVVTTKSGFPFLDVLITPLRGILLPLFDDYRKKDPRHNVLTVPGWAVSELRNTPIPWTVEHQYDFRYGGTYGPPDMPVKAGITNVDKQIMIQALPHIKRFRPQERKYTGIHEFNNEEQENMEIFVYSPFAMPTDLPCSTSMLKY